MSCFFEAQADAIVDTILELVNFYYSKVFPIQDAAEKVNFIKHTIQVSKEYNCKCNIQKFNRLRL
jgi:hypothetical protein